MIKIEFIPKLKDFFTVFFPVFFVSMQRKFYRKIPLKTYPWPLISFKRVCYRGYTSPVKRGGAAAPCIMRKSVFYCLLKALFRLSINRLFMLN